ncbi:hypothetical protein BDN72DRAFT_838861 [Pluteus cervinus]|uniref:Uncharacterized protein n=1 Tax=Pluteus cervinus TaxID=181527 RepID=A0ACD3AX90_9AGAR|nr:hypothetical protein BDN72DRAFT_838861 [Pluteus cervinus]
MSDTEMSDGPLDGPPPGLFFAGSDDDEPAPVEASQKVEVQNVPRQGLFLPDSDDDEERVFPKDFKGKGAPIEDGQESDLPDFEELPRASSPSSAGDHVSISSSSPPPQPVDLFSSNKGAGPSKKRKLSPEISLSTPQATESMYIGEVLVTNAFSNVSGKGYIKPNEVVQVKREDQDDQGTSSTPSNPAPPPKKTKQLTLRAMMPTRPAKASNKKTKVDTIVRLYNSRGFEFARLPTEVSAWVAKLLDYGVVEINGTMTDCPEKLTVGVSLMVTLNIYMRPSAFQPLKTSKDADGPRALFNETAETMDERVLRERKTSILKLFKVVGLTPRAGANFSGRKSDEQVHEEALKRMAQHKPQKVKEVVGDGEEIETEDAENLSMNELDLIYKKAQHNDSNMGLMEAPPSFTLTLRGYQKQALLWMNSLETGAMDAREASSMHPLWSQYAFPEKPDFTAEFIDLTEDEKFFYFNPYSGELSLKFPKAERNCRGGILADEMGMGKTIMLSALIQSSRACDAEPETAEAPANKSRQLRLNKAFRPNRGDSKARTPSATLIVAPTSLLTQWADELQRSSQPGTMEVVVWHGSNRLDLHAAVQNKDEDDKTIKVVVTSYGVLASEHAKVEKSSNGHSPVFDIEWFRVVLDEAHHCKSRTSKTAKAVYAVKARCRWAVTGTPIVNRLEDLYSLLKFLNFKPWSDFAFFRSFITLPFLARDPKAIEVVQIILESILLRREKNMRDTDGNRIVELPPKEVVLDNLEFAPLERMIYDSLYAPIKRNFEKLDAQGLLSKNYTHILAMLMRLRRAVLHPNLVIGANGKDKVSSKEEIDDVNEMIQKFAKGDGAEGGKFAEDVLNSLNEEAAECPICLDVMEIPMLLPKCLHQCCRDCILAFISTREEKGEEGRCPTCSKGPLKEGELVEVMRAQPTAEGKPPGVVLRRNDFRSSTKLEALTKDLRKLRDQDPCFRAVVFSQFTSFLDLIQIVLEREGFDQYRFDGTMDLKKRNAAVSEFKSASRSPKIMIVSLKAGGVGLNLTNANHVFMMDCWWNAATEHQAIDRVHRIGQEKTVYVKHYLVNDTIEGRIVRIQQRKTAIIKEAFRGTQANKDSESIENLKIMFGTD